MDLRKKLRQRIQRHEDGTVERWRDVLGYRGLYRVSDRGRVKALPKILVNKNKPGKRKRGQWSIRHLPMKLLKGCQNIRSGHVSVMLYKNEIAISLYVHRLVLEAFVGPCPPGMECRHFPDRSPSNNRLENLSWGTPKRQWKDKLIHRTSIIGYHTGEAKYNALITNQRSQEIRELWDSNRFKTVKALADHLKLSYDLVWRITKRLSYKPESNHIVTKLIKLSLKERSLSKRSARKN